MVSPRRVVGNRRDALPQESHPRDGKEPIGSFLLLAGRRGVLFTATARKLYRRPSRLSIPEYCTKFHPILLPKFVQHADVDSPREPVV